MYGATVEGPLQSLVYKNDVGAESTGEDIPRLSAGIDRQDDRIGRVGQSTAVGSDILRAPTRAVQHQGKRCGSVFAVAFRDIDQSISSARAQLEWAHPAWKLQ